MDDSQSCNEMCSASSMKPSAWQLQQVRLSTDAFMTAQHTHTYTHTYISAGPFGRQGCGEPLCKLLVSKSVVKCLQ
eukprot:9208280-Karenia_brevis.AAC.1